MKLTSIALLGLLVLFCLVSCSDAHRSSKNGVSMKGGRKGRNKVEGSGKKGRTGSFKKKKKHNYNKDDDDDDKKSKKKRKGRRKGKGTKKGSKGSKDDGNIRVYSKGKSFNAEKGKKNKMEGCRHPDGIARPGGAKLTEKKSGPAPCYEIICEGKKPTKMKWVWKKIPCVTCTDPTGAGVKYLVGYTYDRQCQGGPGECYARVCMADGTWQKSSILCVGEPEPPKTTTPGPTPGPINPTDPYTGTGTPPTVYTGTGTPPTTGTAGTTTTDAVSLKTFTITGTLTGEPWKDKYYDDTSTEFKSLDTKVQNKYKGLSISGYHSSSLKSALPGTSSTRRYATSSSTITKTEVYIDTTSSSCGSDTSCITSEVTTKAKTVFSSVSAYAGSATTVTSTDATTTDG